MEEPAPNPVSPMECTMASLTLTAEFLLFPDDTVLGPRFKLSGYTFRDLGSHPSFVNISGAGKGLQFVTAGLEIRLPLPTDQVALRVAAYGTEVLVTGRDPAGAVLVQDTVPADNQPHDLHLAHSGIAFVELTGGGNEGIVESISTTVYGCRAHANDR